MGGKGILLINETEEIKSNTHHIDNKVRQLPGIVRREVVPATLNQEELGVKLTVEIFESLEVCADVFAY